MQHHLYNEAPVLFQLFPLGLSFHFIYIIYILHCFVTADAQRAAGRGKVSSCGIKAA